MSCRLYLIVQFILVYSLLGLPSLLGGLGVFYTVHEIGFSILSLSAFPLSLGLLYLKHYNRLNSGNPLGSITKGRPSYIYILAQSTIALGILFISGAICKVLTIVLPMGAKEPSVLLAGSPREFIVATLVLFSMALYEEALYRVYIPSTIALMLKVKYRERIAYIASLLLFTIPHAYLGPYAVVNALVAGVLLYRVYKKTGSVLAIAIPHFVYNFTTYIFMYLA